MVFLVLYLCLNVYFKILSEGLLLLNVLLNRGIWLVNFVFYMAVYNNNENQKKIKTYEIVEFIIGIEKFYQIKVLYKILQFF